MTLPDESLRAVKRSRDFLRSILPMKVSDFRKMGKDGFDEWRMRAYGCLRHYPGDYILAKRWADEVCEHGKDRRWCGACKESTQPVAKGGEGMRGVDSGIRFRVCAWFGLWCFSVRED